MSSYKCEVCGQGPMNGTTIFRTGPTGEGLNPHWRCEFHDGRKAAPADVLEITDVIESAEKTRQ